MPLILITGISTSGKSTIAKALLKRGYEAYDTERGGISAWFNKTTGERAAEFSPVFDRTKQWLDQHEWLISKDWVAEMAAKAKDKPIFLCGGSSNEPEIRAMCQKVIWLQTDEATIRKRVSIPRDHDYGTKPHELAKAIQSNKTKEVEYRAYGAALVDARQPLEQVVDEILEKVNL
jgi:adenylate kinase family enzyme